MFHFIPTIVKFFLIASNNETLRASRDYDYGIFNAESGAQ